MDIDRKTTTKVMFTNEHSLMSSTFEYRKKYSSIVYLWFSVLTICTICTSFDSCKAFLRPYIFNLYIPNKCNVMYWETPCQKSLTFAFYKRDYERKTIITKHWSMCVLHSQNHSQHIKAWFSKMHKRLPFDLLLHIFSICPGGDRF